MPRKSRNTKQKENISKEMGKIDGFFSAEDLYTAVKKRYPEIGLATVYRYLSFLSRSKQIFSYLCSNRHLYSKDKKSHCHFICEETGKVIHFDVDSLDFLKNKIPGEITSFQIEVKGRCSECLKK